MITFLVLVPLGAGLAGFALPWRRWRTALLLVSSAFHLAVTAGFWRSLPRPEWGGFAAVDRLALPILFAVSALFFAVSIYAAAYFKGQAEKSHRILIGCLLCFLSSMTLAAVSRHLGLFWVAVEATTLASAPLIHLEGTRQGLEATWKYLMICSVGIALALLGTFFLAISAAGTKTLAIEELVKGAHGLARPWLKLSAVFLLVGYGTKMGLAPMHTWLPDAHSEAPAPVSALLSGALLNCAFLGILRIGQICGAAGEGPFFGSMLALLGLLSLGVAAVFIWRQNDYKRMFAYSSVEHMGILALGIGLGGSGFYGSLFHAVNHTFAKGMLFMTAGNLYQRYHTKRASDIRGVLRTDPLTGVLLAAGFLAIAGMPPFATFHSELMILNAAVTAKRYGTAFFYLLFLVVIFAGMAGVIFKMAQGAPLEAEGARAGRRGSWAKTIAPLVLVLLVLLLGFYVPPFLDEAFKEAGSLLMKG